MISEIMKRNFLLFTFVLFSFASQAQTWVDTLYAIQTTHELEYGRAIDFAGNERSLTMDISTPVGDTPPTCGRPLMVLIHGGAFFAGSKEDFAIQRMRQDFAKRGYTTAAVNYRLGLFQTHLAVNCNISALGAEWNCLNMADSSEWYRAYFRAIQDINGAIRYLVNHANDYDIDPQNIFLVGESAGGFIAMGAGYLDDASEVLPGLTSMKANVLPPNSIYEMTCIQGYGLDTSINSMALTRPDLGSYEGILNLPVASSYQIRGVGNFFGAVFNNIFASSQPTIPALYLFHQPNDLIVPYGHNRVFGGYAHCASQFPFSCQNIINRPHVYGSQAIQTMIDDMATNQVAAPDYQFENTNNTSPCPIQIANPSQAGHAIDNYWLRTSNMAAFFAGKVNSCTTSNIAASVNQNPLFSLSPNPVGRNGSLQISADLRPGYALAIFDMQGRNLWEYKMPSVSETFRLDLSTLGLSEGIYLFHMRTRQGYHIGKLIVGD